MAITYSIDEKQRLLHSEFSGIVHVDDFYAHIESLRNDKNFQPDFCGLYDWQQVKNITVDYNAMQSITSDCPWGEGSYRAIVVSKPLIFGMSRMFQSLSDDISGTIQIFRKIDDAEAWLDSICKH